MRYISCFSRRAVSISADRRTVASKVGIDDKQTRYAHCTWYRLQLWSESVAHTELAVRAQPAGAIIIATRVHSPVIKVSARPFVRANRAFLACHLLMRTNASRESRGFARHFCGMQESFVQMTPEALDDSSSEESDL